MKIKELTIDELHKNSFHDIHIDKIEIQLTYSTELSLHAEYEKYSWLELEGQVLTFKEIDSFQMDDLILGKSSEIELYSANFEKIDSFISVEMMFLTGFGGPSFEIKFLCKSIELKKTAHNTR